MHSALVGFQTLHLLEFCFDTLYGLKFCGDTFKCSLSDVINAFLSAVYEYSVNISTWLLPTG